ncbi:MAG: OmpA family protein [Flavobacteriales bacterium]|nr:OmpA family protein [Flavobacteriales bacterium]
MKNSLTSVFVLFILGASAQQDIHLNRVTVYGGATNYLGEIEQDLMDSGIKDKRFGALGYQHFLGYGTSLYTQASVLELQGNDLNGGDVLRGANFRSSLRTVELGLRTYLDNGSWFNYDARFAPFLSIGAGVGSYSTQVDQYDANGQRYNYWNDGTVRDLPQNDPNAAMATITGQDGTFETDVTELNTFDGKKSNNTFVFIPAQVGLKVRLSQRFSVDIAYGLSWTFTDQLDDLSGPYRTNARSELAYLSNPTGAIGERGDASTNDRYQHVSIGIGYSFGRRSHRYRMTPVYLDHLPEADADTTSQAPNPAPPAPPAITPTPPANVVEGPEEVRVKRLVISELIVDTIIFRSTQKVVPPRTDSIPSVSAMRDTSKMRTPILKKPEVAQADSIRNKGGAQSDTLKVRSPEPTIPTVAKVDSAAHPIRTDSTERVSGAMPRIVVPVSDSASVPSVEPLMPASRIDTVAAMTVVPVAVDSLPMKPDTTTPIHAPTTPLPVPADSSKTGSSTPAEPVRPKTVVTPSVPPPSPPYQDRVTPTTVTPPTKTTEVVRTVVVPVVVDQSGNEDARIRSLEDSLNVTRAEQKRLAAELDSVPAKGIAPTPSVTDTTSLAVALARSQKQQRYASQLNSILLDRIAIMERYMDLQDQQASDSSLAILRDSVLLLDGQVQLLRDSLRMERTDRKLEPGSKLESKVGEKVKDEVITGDQAITDTLYFRSGSVYVLDANKARIAAIAKEYLANGRGKILVTGHTDRSGNATFNRSLSQQRAEAVAKYLREAGVPATAIKVKGLGEQLARSTYDLKERNVVIQRVSDPDAIAP